MKNKWIVRTYGNPPYSVFLVHGGPGAGGEMAPVARRLSSAYGVAEPIQTEITLKGQIEELHEEIVEIAQSEKVTLVGYSWGAWLVWLVAANYPQLIKKIILVSSGPFEQKYVDQIAVTRKNRLTSGESEEFDQLIKELELSNAEEAVLNQRLAQLGQLVQKTDDFMHDVFDDQPGDRMSVRGNVFQIVWNEAEEMRKDERLIQLAKQIRCPVVAIHGDYDPHPAEGVHTPLKAAGLTDFRFILLRNCGHTPWNEREAREEFYRCLASELKRT